MEIVSVIGSDLFKYFSRRNDAFLDKPIFAGVALFYAVVFTGLWYNDSDILCGVAAGSVAARYDWRLMNDHVI